MIKRNQNFYKTTVLLIEAARIIKEEDYALSNELLDKAQECKNKIIIDENMEKEIDSYERCIEKRL